MTQLMNDERHDGGEAEFPVGSWERPDPAGIVRRGEAATRVRRVRREVRTGEAPVCYVGSKPGVACDRPAVMEVYGIPMCEAHGEEAAAGALEEISYDLEVELQRPMNPHLPNLSPHFEAALRHGFEALGEEIADTDYERRDETLLRAFPLDRERADAETLAYVEDPDAHGHGTHHPPYDTFMGARLLVCRLMRLAFEEDADWLVGALEVERENAASAGGLRAGPGAGGGPALALRSAYQWGRGILRGVPAHY